MVDGSPSSLAQSSSSSSYEVTNGPLGISLPQNHYQMACGSTCSGNADCQYRSSGCSCRTQKETLVRGKGTVAFSAICMINLAGKREESFPCPCNATYVSHACCGVESGMVWEDASLKLGELFQSGKH